MAQPVSSQSATEGPRPKSQTHPDAGRQGPSLVAPLSSFIGREHEIEAIVPLLRQDGVRLVTLTGPGGVGKTRLALQIADRLESFFPDGVVTVSLAPIRDPDLVLSAIAQAVGIRDAPGIPISQQLADVLRDQEMLLLLDNFEQVVDAGPEFATLLAACPGLKALVTSRTVLHLSGEHDVAIGPLDLPAPGVNQSLAAIADASAVQLFVQRARAAASDLLLTDDNAQTVIAICRQVDSLPLAIELAAARVAHLSLPALLERLEHRLPLLTGGARDQLARHRTMRDTIAWSYDLLTPAEQALFRRLAVFVGGFTLEAAEAIGGDGVTDVLDLVSSLADKSLLRRSASQDPNPRYVMLETLREFGVEQLTSTGEERAVRAAHAAYFLQLAERTEPLLYGSSALSGYAVLERERGNLRAALRWLDSTGEGEALLRLAAALGYFWEMIGPWSEGDYWLERALATSTEPISARIRALHSLATNASYQGLHDRAQVLLDEALELVRTLESDHPRASVADILLLRGTDLIDQGSYAEAAVALREALDMARGSHDRELEGLALTHLGVAAWGLGQPAEATASLEAGRAVGIEAGHPLSPAVSSRYLAHIALSAGDLATAAERFRGFWNYDRTGNHVLARLVPDITALAVATGAPQRAAELFGAAETLARETGIGHGWPERGLHEYTLAHTRAALEQRSFDAAFQAGMHLSRDDVLDLIDQVLSTAERPPAPAGPDESTVLTPREREVLSLIVSGLSNTEIGDRLFISSRTAQTHVTNILGKLGVSSRTEAAAKAIREGLI